MLDEQKSGVPKMLVKDEGAEFDSETLKRLIEEVRAAPLEPTAYNRTHNRHNRT